MMPRAKVIPSRTWDADAHSQRAGRLDSDDADGQRDLQPEVQVHPVGVRLRQAAGVEHHHHRRPGEHPQRAGDQCPRGAVALAEPNHDGDCDGDADGAEHQDREGQQVWRDDPPSQLGAHHDTAPHRLEQHADRPDGGHASICRERRGRARAITRKAPSEATSTTPVSVRLANSIARCSPARPERDTGTNDPGWHYGQVAQPSPEPVTRTVAPFTVSSP